MGKCFSCEEQNRSSVQNGQTRTVSGSSRQPSRSSVGLPVTVIRKPGTYETKVQIPPTDPNYTTFTTVTTTTTATTVETDRKSASTASVMFGQYPKLPIRKLSGGESKRFSLPNENRINALYEQYKEPDEEFILAEGIERFCRDLDVKPDEFRVLVLAWKFQAETMCRFTRGEFVNGFKTLKVDSIKGIQSKFPEMLQEVKNKDAFKEFYRWTFKFGLDADVGQRTLPVDIAKALWHLVFINDELPILKRWLNFLDDHPGIRGISKDTWDMFLNFVEVVGDDLSTYDDTEAWPSLFDDFVEYENDRENQNFEPNKQNLDLYRDEETC
ncbi:DCN1-like protein 3 [Tubulanus polymorphus]|uniref:DCN1-like protein 3 n=1 Tax=Tubulanus polymorphus TaxID=672921 RepID=UPI003DA3E9BA